MKKLQTLLVAVLLLISAVTALADNPYQVTTATVYPQGTVNFGFVSVNTTGAIPRTISIFNQSKDAVTVNSVIIGASQFKLVTNPTPMTIAAGAYGSFSVSFTPTAAVSYSTTMTFKMASPPDLNVTLAGNGASSTAKVQLSVSSLTFAPLPLGAKPSPLTITISNVGTTSFKISGVTVTHPFAETGYSGTAIKVAPGTSFDLLIACAPKAIGTVNGSLLISYDVLPPSGVSLSASGIASTTLGIVNDSLLPNAVQNAAYKAVLISSGAVGATTWSLRTGSSLPGGLTLSSSGIVSGTVSSSVAVGSYSFTAQVTDSATPKAKTASFVLTLAVAAPTGANCNNIVTNDENSNPLVAINDLGVNYYQNKYQGGLYAGGSNVDDPVHDAFGRDLAAGIAPLDENGNPSSTGKYVLLTAGHSNTQGVSTQLVDLAMNDPLRNPSLVVVNGATGSAGAAQLQDVNSFYWQVITNTYLPNAGVTAKQVVAAWVNDVDAEGHPPSLERLQTELEGIMRNLLVKFPNLKLVYLSSVNYTGYSNGVTTEYVEPYAYEAGFAVKNAIQDQLNGNTDLNFDPLKGHVVAAWMAWGPYYWTNGLQPRSDGLIWACTDAVADGTHPSAVDGRLRAASTIMDFLKTDATATPWYSAH